MRLVTPLRFAVAASAVLLALSPALSPALGQNFPDQPIRLMVPTPAGGMADILSRVFAQKVKANSGATVIVENKTGANGVLAADTVAKSAPNGLTVLIGFQGTNAVLPHLDPKLPYKPLTDFEPVVLVASAPCVLVVHPSFPAKTVKEFVAIVKQKPGGYSYASAGFGTTHHLAAELFKIAADVNLVGVTYRGAAPANQDVIAGHIPIVFDNLGNAMNNIHAGHVRALAVTTASRAPQLPDVPTMAEAGVPNVVVSSWFALFVPAGTPKEAIAWLNKQANDAFSAPEVREQFARQGVALPLGTPEALGAHVAAEYKKWGEVVRKANITLPQ
jgi:tripartite-type tricarboxylate transporter receptor subunit TctC